jgi:hypothetical protein
VENSSNDVMIVSSFYICICICYDCKFILYIHMFIYMPKYTFI